MKPILEVIGISKKYTIHHSGREPYLSLRDSITRLFKGSKNSSEEEFWALKNINFEVNPGDSIGIIGRNGAGKSTLLKILSKITPPSEGRIISRGRIASLLEVGTGFHSELSGRENIYLNGSILGLKKTEINKQFDAIVDFSGVEKFLDTPLKHYSSGMQLRLAFAVAAHLEPEILIIDEVLAVGDMEFQAKCMGKMNEVSKSGRTLLFVSHDLNAVANLCKSIIVIKNGTVNYNGEVMKGIVNYQEGDKINTEFIADASKLKKEICFRSIKIRNAKENPSSHFLYNEPVIIDFELKTGNTSVRWDLFVMILDSRKRRVFALESNQIKEKMRLVLEPELLVRGQYSICAFINQPNVARIDEAYDVCSFEIIDNGSQMLKHGEYDYGSVFGKGKWIL
jgi:lipopolysaccharide transport system ATP-binding protein